MKAFWRLGAVVSLLAAGCSSKSPLEGAPDASVILQPNARIADMATRQALRRFDRDAGTLLFAPEASQVAAWTQGDVVVSAACPGAPAGFLRRITSISSDPQGLLLNTVQANLSDVIKNGGAEGSFLIKSRPSPPDAESSAIGQKSPALALGDQRAFDFDYRDDNITLQAKGHEATFAGINLRVNIDGLCAVNGDPCFEFAAGADLSDHFDIDASASGHKEWNQTFLIADDTYDPIELDIGPVPLVFIPHIESELDVDETVKADVHIVASGNGPDFHLAVHWDSSNGFSSEHSSKPADMSGTASFEGDATAHAKLPTTLRLLLYDVGGVEARLTPQLSARLQTPGKPLWTLDGRFVGEIGVTAQLPIIGDLGRYDQTLIDESFHVAQAPNNSPIPSVLEPVRGQTVNVGPPDNSTVYMRAVASDQEDGELCCTFRWSLPDGTPLGSGSEISYIFPRPGHYEILVTATDSDGASRESEPVGIDIVAYPPGARILVPSGVCATRLYVGYPVRIRGADTGLGFGDLPFDCRFGSTPLTGGVDPDFPIDVPRDQVTPNVGCDIMTTFSFADYRDIHLLIRQFNPDGSYGLGSIVDRMILVTQPPPGAVPIFLPPGPPGCAPQSLGETSGHLDLYVQTYGDASTGLQWQWQAAGCAAVPVNATLQLLGVCTPEYCPAHYTLLGSDVRAATPPGCDPFNGTGEITVTATSASGPPQSATLSVYLSHDVIR